MTPRDVPFLALRLPGAGDRACIADGGERVRAMRRSRSLRGRGAVVRPGCGRSHGSVSPGVASGAGQGDGSAKYRRCGGARAPRRQRPGARAAVPVADSGGGRRRRGGARAAPVGPVRRGRRRSARSGCGSAGMEQAPPSVLAWVGAAGERTFRMAGAEGAEEIHRDTAARREGERGTPGASAARH